MILFSWGRLRLALLLNSMLPALKIDVDLWPMARSVVAINNLGIRRDCAAA